MSRLLQLGRDAVELGIEAGADRIDGGDDHDRNAGGNQAVFNRGSAGLILQKRKYLRHQVYSMLFYKAASYPPPVKGILGVDGKVDVPLSGFS